jgi:tetratricopeptide (TPR) repeat protein
VADYFPDIEQGAGAMRAISAQLSGWQIAPETVMLYTNKGVEMISSKSALRFYLTRSLSISNARLGNIDKAVQLLDDALSYLPDDWREDPDLVGMVEVAYSEKARYYEYLNKPEDAVKSYDESRNVNPNTALSGWLLDDITRVYQEERDPKAVQLYKLVQSWSDKERSAWLGYMFENGDDFAVMRLNQIAGYGGQEERDFVTSTYDKYISTLTPPSNSLFMAKASLATLYRAVLGDEAKALELLRELIKTNLADYDFSMVVEERFSEVRGELADMIFSEFCSTADPIRKTALLEEIKNIPVRYVNLRLTCATGESVQRFLSNPCTKKW